MSKKSLRRLHRRKYKAAIHFGSGAKPSHTLKTGRTGMVHSKRLQSGVSKKGTGRRSVYEYIPGRGLVLVSQEH